MITDDFSVENRQKAFFAPRWKILQRIKDNLLIFNQLLQRSVAAAHLYSPEEFISSSTDCDFKSLKSQSFSIIMECCFSVIK